MKRFLSLKLPAWLFPSIGVAASVTIELGMRTIRELGTMDLRGKLVLVRVDYDVPYEEKAERHPSTGAVLWAVKDDTKIRASIPTIRYLLKRGAGVLLMSDLGGSEDTFFVPAGPKFSLWPVATRLQEILQEEGLLAESEKVPLPWERIGDETDSLKLWMRETPPRYRVALFENLRFYFGEKSPEERPSFSEALFRDVDFYVNDAPTSIHLPHASVIGPSGAPKYAGLQLA